MLIPVIESILPKIVIRETRNISKTTISENNTIFEGSDFLSLIDLLKIEDGKYIDPLEFFDIYKSTSNDIYSISNFLGIEAARESIINEIISVFDAYGIEIDIRHLMLIADYMTRNGEYVPFNRTGLNYCNSPLQKMSFESCFTNLKKASEFHVSDDLSNPSASLTVGTPVKVGTNTFEILYNMDSQTV
ncbi:dna-directed rna polymerase subunit alpha [Vairimorpha apis BRL 01]|uniref:DNA-directed RNA polymerase n=1 Tax=Vairimorpha apis BRL 01 TaxID=1037528 RepID=T0MJN8_9MICR|nr:dna-directed rna polymerase subunit alpha [Vairimorpha apis BRL 01]